MTIDATHAVRRSRKGCRAKAPPAKLPATNATFTFLVHNILSSTPSLLLGDSQTAHAEG